MASTKVQRIMTQPINLIFRFLQSKARIQIWLFEQKDLRIEGRIIGFDEYMNLVLDDAEEVNVKKKSRKSLGRILLKGDNITLMMNRLSKRNRGRNERFKGTVIHRVRLSVSCVCNRCWLGWGRLAGRKRQVTTRERITKGPPFPKWNCIALEVVTGGGPWLWFLCSRVSRE
ncbi:hypothetical protein REPUB_Repub18cG0046000 [Reevesia pubescens]